MSESENVSLVCQGLALYRSLFAPPDRWAVSVVIFGTRHYGNLCRAYAFMALYIVHGHSWRVMLRVGIYDTLFRDWATVTDKKILGLQKPLSSVCEPTRAH
jgi:hypothetical protein